MAQSPESKVIHVPMTFSTAKIVFKLLAEIPVADSRVLLSDLVGLKTYVEDLRSALNTRREMEK